MSHIRHRLTCLAATACDSLFAIYLEDKALRRLVTKADCWQSHCPLVDDACRIAIRRDIFACAPVCRGGLGKGGRRNALQRF